MSEDLRPVSPLRGNEKILSAPNNPDPLEAPGESEVEVPRNFWEILFGIVRPLAPYLFAASLVLLFFVAFILEPPDKEAAAVERETADPVFSEPAVGGGIGFGYDAEVLQRESRLREALIQERGGRVFLDSLRSEKWQGTIDFGSGRKEMIVLKMVPDLIVIRIVGEDEQLSLGYNGSEYWKFLSSSNGFRDVLEIEPLEKNILQVLSGVHGPLLRRFMDGRGRVVLVEGGQSSVYGEFIRVVFSAGPGEKPGEVDLDPSDLSLLRWESEAADGSLFVVNVEESEVLAGIPYPSQLSLWKDGELQFEMEIDELIRNFGAVRMLFENPVEQGNGGS